MKTKRKSPIYKELLICTNCGKETERTGPVQKYCKTCSAEKDRSRKKQWYVKNNPNAYAVPKKRFCDICGSDKDVSSFKGNGSYCSKHYYQMYRYGYTFEGIKKWRINTYVTRGAITFVYTVNKEKIIIDTADLEKIKDHYWSVNSQGYVITVINHKHKRLHLFLLGKTKGYVTDHKNGNKLDNRKSNLRKTTLQLNVFNATVAKNNNSGRTGVSQVTKKTKITWRARIMKDRKDISLGYHKTKEQAINARKKAELKYFGENILCQIEDDELEATND